MVFTSAIAIRFGEQHFQIELKHNKLRIFLNLFELDIEKLKNDFFYAYDMLLFSSQNEINMLFSNRIFVKVKNLHGELFLFINIPKEIASYYKGILSEPFVDENFDRWLVNRTDCIIADHNDESNEQFYEESHNINENGTIVTNYTQNVSIGNNMDLNASIYQFDKILDGFKSFLVQAEKSCYPLRQLWWDFNFNTTVTETGYSAQLLLPKEQRMSCW